MLIRALLPLAVAFALSAQEAPSDLASLRYIDIVKGAGAPAAAGKRFTVHYTGWLKDGTKFDSSVDRKEPLGFVQGRRQVITGWDIGIEGMQVGGKRKLFIPYQLAYGEAGTGPIPPKAELVFDVELLDVTDAPAAPAAIDVLLPYSDLETKVLALARGLPDEKFQRIAASLRHITALNLAVPEGTEIKDPEAAGRMQTVEALAASFADVHRRLDTARAGFLSADSIYGGKPTTRRGLYIELATQIAEEYGRAIELTK